MKSYKFIGYAPNSILTFNNDNFLLIVYNDRFEIYDSNINLINTLTSINDKKIACCKAITNKKNLIYMCEYNSHRIKVIDEKFNEVKFETKMPPINKLVNKKRIYPHRQEPLFYPFDLSYHSDGFIFICDLRNKIFKFKENIQEKSLEYVLDYQVNFQIKQCAINDRCLFLNSINSNKIYFLNLQNFDILMFYESSGGPILELDSYFFEFSGNYGEMISCYDENGCFLDIFDTRFSNIIFNNSVCMKRFFDKILISTSCGKLITI